MAISKFELGELIKELESHKGKHTELVTVYVSGGYDMNAVQRQLEAEKSTAKNIKSTTTRNNVIDALEKVIREMKTFRKTPENGVAFFTGNISQVEGQQDIGFWQVEPPMPLKTRLYRCDKEFVLDPLKEMMEVDEVFGLLVMDRKEATIGILEGKLIRVEKRMTSGVPSQIKAGGQSSQRFHRVLEGLTKDFYKRIAEEMKNIFYEMKKLKGIIVGGPVPTKDEFLDGEYMMTRLREKVIGRIDTGDTSESGLKELVEKSNDLLAQQEITKEKKEVQGFFEALAKTPDRSSIDLEHIKKSLEMGAVEKLFISERVDKKVLHELQQMAENTGADIKLISTETEEGIQFYNLRGVGAILRYKVH